MDSMIEIKEIEFEKDKKNLTSLTKQSVKFGRFVKENDIDDFATKFFLNAYKEATIALGAYINNVLQGFILFSSYLEKTGRKDFPEKLYEKLSEKFSKYKFLEDNDIYRKTCETLLVSLNQQFDGEITLFVVDKNARGNGLGKILLTKCLNLIIESNHQNIFLTSDNECNYTYYQKYGFNIEREGKVKHSKEEVTVYIETKKFY